MSIRHEKYPIVGGGDDDLEGLIARSLPVPTRKQLEAIYDGQSSGEQLFADRWSDLKDQLDWWQNDRMERLAGLRTSIRDYEYLRTQVLWTDNDIKWLDKITIDYDTGCWELPYYKEKPGPMENRARYPQPYAYDFESERSYKMMGARWMWQRVVGEIGTKTLEINPATNLEGKKPKLWVHHACENKGCVYPRHHHMGTRQFNDAERKQLEAIFEVRRLQENAWRRPSPGIPEGITDEMISKLNLQPANGSKRAVILPAEMSRIELEVLSSKLHSHKRNHLPDDYTVDPAYHLAKACILSGEYTFDEVTGCFISKIVRNLPQTDTCIPVGCGNLDCFNPRHMDIADKQSEYYELQPSDYITLVDKTIRHIDREDKVLPPYWVSWDLYMNWFKPKCVTFNPELGDYESTGFFPITPAEFTKSWVHPLTGCWESVHFYPRWDKGIMSNGYGSNRGNKSPAGVSMHLRVLFEFMADEMIDESGSNTREVWEELTDLFSKLDCDHFCKNRRCFNPYHTFIESRKVHNHITHAARWSKSKTELVLLKDEIAEFKRLETLFKAISFRGRQLRRERGLYVPSLK